jgi:hypothetical protein
LSRIFPPLALFLVLVAALPALSGAAATRVAANTKTFDDSVNENGGAGPDIKSVTVSNDNTGLISFDINVPNQAALSGEKLTDLLIDSDNNPATGDPDPLNPGADYAIELFQNQVNLYKWDGQTYSRTASGPSQATLIFSQGATGPKISISNVELGNTKKFNFNVTAISGVVFDASGNLDFTNAQADFAPDLGHGLYSYDVKTAKLKLVARSVKIGSARAGGLFTISMAAVRNDTGAVLQGGTVKCVAKINGASVGARTHKVANKRAVCAWQLPGSARGKRITGSITVVFEGQKVTKTFSASIH